MKKITYIGALPSIELDVTTRSVREPRGEKAEYVFSTRTVRAKRGEPVEVSEAIADELLKREDFTEIGTDVVNVPFTPTADSPTAGVPESGTPDKNQTP